MRLLAAMFAVAGILAGAPAWAVTLNVDFSFENLANGGGTVTGRVLGLQDDAADQAATGFQILSNTAGFGIGEYIGAPENNLWTVSGGVVTNARFSTFGDRNVAPAVTDASFYLQYVAGQTGLVGLAPTPFRQTVSAAAGETLRFEVAPVPVPQAAVLLGSGLVALFALRRRRRREATTA